MVSPWIMCSVTVMVILYKVWYILQRTVHLRNAITMDLAMWMVRVYVTKITLEIPAIVSYITFNLIAFAWPSDSSGFKALAKVGNFPTTDRQYWQTYYLKHKHPWSREHLSVKNDERDQTIQNCILELQLFHCNQMK